MASETRFILTVNGQRKELNLPEDTPVLAVLRQDFGLRGTRIGCSEGSCGACTVLLDGHPVQSCTLPLWSAAGHDVTTIETFPRHELLNRVRQAFLEIQAAQCGYCTNGIMMTVAGLLAQSPPASRARLIAILDERHLCRCGAQARILQAIDRVMAHKADVDA